ncbi:MAG: peptidylprolyl isomerase [Alphaproteobacteria bacterium CG_4_9_14_3_um_filter_47_13]|nr:MAG: peptidylprolyl isomerase [Alphaproteobacteria bacterium CG_4_9_14_3_um_filter_47_13]
MFKKLTLTAWSLLIMTVATTGNAQAADPQDTLYLELDSGRVTIEMLPDIAPKHVERITTLTQEGFYDGIVWHRVIDGFMAQTGDPTGTGMGGSELPDLPAEFSDYQYKRGTIGMARTQSPDSANSQFFICFTDDGCDFLTGQYTVWGQVTEGMELIDNLSRGEPPVTPDKIVKMQLASDLAAAEAARKAQGTVVMPSESAPVESPSPEMMQESDEITDSLEIIKEEAAE